MKSLMRIVKSMAAHGANLLMETKWLCLCASESEKFCIGNQFKKPNEERNDGRESENIWENK